MVSPVAVVQGVLNNMWQNGWNPAAAKKNHNGTWTSNNGGLWINWEQAINWSNYDQNTQVNMATPDSNAVSHGLTSFNSHDPQTCLQYVHAVALYMQLFPNDTRFIASNTNGFMSLSAMMSHIIDDFSFATSSSSTVYNNPKGWVYWAWKDIYLVFGNRYDLFTATQISNMFSCLMFQAFTYLNTYWDATNQYTVDTSHNTYQPSQSLLMSAAVIDAGLNYPTAIFSNMFFDTTPFSPQTAVGWIAAGTESAYNLLSRGAWNNSLQFTYGVMNVIDGFSQDTVNDAVCKADDVSESVVALVRLSYLVGDPLFANYAFRLANSIDKWLLDTVNGGYYSNLNVSTGIINAAYKETRATGHMLYAYTLYNQYVQAGVFSSRIQTTLEALTSSRKYYKTTGGTGFWYRTLPGVGFGNFVDNYTPDYASTLQANINIGDTSCSVVGNPSAVSTDECTIINYGGANEEQFVGSYQSVTGAGPYSLPYNQGANSPLHFQKAHTAGEPIQTMLYPISLIETQYTTEAMGNISTYILYTLLQTEDLYNVADSASQSLEVIGMGNTPVFSVPETGGVTVTSGTMALLGTIFQCATSGSAQAPSGAGQTLVVNTVVNRKAPGAACTGTIMAPGTINGQLCIITNESQNTNNTITFAAPATSNVWDDGTNPPVIKAGTAKMFVWISALNTTGAWVPFGPFGG